MGKQNTRLAANTDVGQGSRWYIRQIHQHSSGSFNYSLGFKYVYLNRAPVHSDVLTTERANEVIQLTAEGPWVKLLFHTHAWCGAITLDVNGVRSVVDLYSPEHGFRELVLDCGQADRLDIVITTGAQPHSDAKAQQLWLAAVDFSIDQSWTPISRPVSPTCSLTKGKYGTFLTLTNDTIIGASIVSEGCWAPKDVAFFEQYIKPGMTVLDVGANIGHHTVVYGRLVGPEGRVVAFEPQATIYRVLAANVVLNGGQNTDLIQSCVGESDGYVHLYPINYSSQTNFGALGVDPNPDGHSRKGEKCRVAKIDVLLDELNAPLQRVDFIKIDVQSFELYALRGAEKTLSLYKPTLFLEVSPYWMSKSYDYREIYRYLWSLGYEIIHPTDPELPAGTIKEWSGRNGEEWDIVAVFKQK
jgi:FkbM family methyltransferase